MNSLRFALPLLLAGSVSASLAMPKTPVASAALPPFRFSTDNLEARWSYRARIEAPGQGAAQWLFGKDEDDAVILALTRANGKLVGEVRRVGGKAMAPLRFPLSGGGGEIGVIRVGRLLQVLWNGQVKAQLQTDLGGVRFGMRVSDGWKRLDAHWQPTEPVVFRDDFMRADGPDSPAMTSSWTAGNDWKTSGTLGPRADSSLSPNPFVFRATGVGTHVARAGKWFWNDYTVSASVRAEAPDGDDSALVAGLGVFGDGAVGVRGDVDFRTGIARLSENGRVIAQSAPFDAAIHEWHRMRLEPGGGVVRLFFDGREVASAKCDLAAGEVALRATTGARGFVDFDDVRVQSGADEAGEGQLPERLVKDRLMRNWANAASAWKRDTRGVWWHTGDFWGAAALEVPLPKLEDGQGFRFYLNADAAHPQGAAPQVLVERHEGKLRAVVGAKSAPLPDAPERLLRLEWAPTPNGALTGALVWNGVRALALATARDAAGTKIGIEPTRSGAPLPVPALQKLELTAATFERDNHSVIGVNITPVSPAIARDMGLPDATGAVIDNVEAGSPAQIAGFRNGDVVRFANGARVTDVDTMRSAVGAVRAPGSILLQILRAPGDGSGLDWATCRATTPNELDYAFTSAPVDWKPARGEWEVAERWTCSPQWSFFAGQNDEFPLLWSRFALKGDWTLEAYLATPMDLTRGERSPTDLNISVGDGKSISSGYSFAFAARNRSQNLIWRRDELIASKPFEMPPSAGETHQDWFYVRLERRHTPRGVRFRWSVNGQSVGEAEDTNPLAAANRLAFWTKNGALSIARVRLWHDGLLPLAPEARPLATPVKAVATGFSPRGSGRDASARLSLAKDGALEVSNPRDGGEWALNVPLHTDAPAPAKSAFSFAYRVTPDVKLNLYALVANSWREIAWTGGAAKPEDNQATLGAIESVVADNQWHTARFDLTAALQKNGLAGARVEALAFAAPSRDYLRQGLGGNALGARFWLRDWKWDG